MARPRRAVIRQALAQNRSGLTTKVNPRGRGWMNPAGASGQRNRSLRTSAGLQREGGGQGGAGAPSPSTGLPQGSTAMPWDPQATLETAGAFRNAQDKLAGLRGNWDAEQRSIGIGAGYENNPYSQASLLQRQREIG